MTFKASFNPLVAKIKDKSKPKGSSVFIFTKSQIFYEEKNNRNWEFENLDIKEGDYYQLLVTDNINIDKRYRIIINNNSTISIALDKKNERLLKWTHRLYYIQKESSNWLKTAIITCAFSLLTYFVGQKIGFKSGYQDGLKEGKLEALKPIQKQ